MTSGSKVSPSEREPRREPNSAGLLYSNLGGLIPGRVGDAAVGGGKWKPIEWRDRSVG
jgi:hypothetical protein